MAINRKKGFALLVSVIFVSVVLALGTALSSLGYKQQILASSAIRSQYAFYSADAVMECVLLDIQKSASSDPYSYANHGSGRTPSCGDLGYPNLPYGFYGGPPYLPVLCYNDAACPNQRVTRQLFPVSFEDPIAKVTGTERFCAEVTVYEQNGKPAGTTWAFVEGYDVPCAEVGTNDRIVARGIFARF
jgi:hypothetical protein